MWPTKLWLYRDGDECSEVTGGWEPYSKKTGTTAKKTANALKITMDGNGFWQDAQFCTKKAIDFTGYSKICFVVYANIGKLQGSGDDSMVFALIEQYQHFHTDWDDSDLLPTNIYSFGVAFKQATVGEFKASKTNLPSSPAYPAVRASNGISKSVLTLEYKEIWLEK